MATDLRLLLAAPNWLGDLVMATSLLDLFDVGAERAGLPRPELHVSVRRRWRPLLEGDPRLAGLLEYRRTGRHAGLAGIWRQARDWRATGPGAAILLPPSLRAGLAARMSGLGPRVGFRGDGRDLLLSDPVTRPRRGTLHYTEELARLYAAWVRAVTGSPAPDGLPVPAPRLAAPSGPVPPGLADGPPIWAVAVGATYGDAKTWPPTRAAELASALFERGGVRVVLLGEASARPYADEIRSRVDAPWRETLAGDAGGVDLVGRTDLIGLAGLLSGAAVFVGNDSGAMHLAAALGTPTVGIFGSSSPVWTRPLGARAAVVAAEDFPCQPCFRRSCDQPRFCLDTIGSARVLAAADALLEAPGAAPGRRLPDDAVRPDRPEPVLFVDRDGVIIEDANYIRDPGDVVLVPGAAAALSRARAAGLRVVVLTNQSGIGRGYYDEADFTAVQDRVDALLAAEGVVLDGLFYCTHAPEAGCNCRKPRPGLLEAAARSFRWTTDRAWMVGDKTSDLELGRRAGLEAYLVRTGQGAEAAAALAPAPGLHVVDDLAAAVDRILASESS